MPRRTFDTIVSTVGLLLAIVLVAAGGLLFWGYSFANTEVTQQLRAQNIFFPPPGSESLDPPEVGPFLNRYAGEQLVTGQQAKAYADHFIAFHLEAVNEGKTYAETSAESRANPDNAELAAGVQTLFRGETLRGLLLNAYAFWQLGQLALYGAIGAWAVALVMAVLAFLGFRHRARVMPDERIFEQPARMPRPA